MKTIRIFISSPGDVSEERGKARKVIENLQKRYADRLRLETVLWEDLPLGVVNSFQGGIDAVLGEDKAVDVAVFILWSRLGSPLGTAILKPDGTEYRSGTEREFDLMLAAYEQSGRIRPQILVYVRQDQEGLIEAQRGKDISALGEMIRQRELVDAFIREEFQDAETGANLRAYHTFAEPNSFAERLKIHLCSLFDAISLDGGLDVGTWEGSPYRGLEVFRAEHAPIFFGRDEEVCKAIERLRAQAEAGCAFLLLVGASGSGKSSLARAGILPALESDNPDDTVAEWRTTALTPGECADGLCRALARTLLDRLPNLRGDERGLDDLEQALRDGQSKALSLLLRRACAGTGGRGPVRLVLLVDQLEELFTHSAIAESEAAAFLAALQALAGSGCVWVLATVRSDYYDRCQHCPALMTMKGDRGQMDLLPPKPSDIHRIITGPAVLAGVSFEKNAAGESLDHRLLNDAAGHPEALPLLEFALAQLYEARTAEGVFTFAQYEKLGGLEGAIGRHAEAVFLVQSVAVRAALGSVFGKLVAFDTRDKFRPTRRHVTMDNLSSTSEQRQLVEALLAARLLCSDRGEVFIAHEALLRCWERIVRWTDSNRECLLVRDRVSERMAQDGALTEADPLTRQVRHHFSEQPDAFDPSQCAYITAQFAQIDADKSQRERVRWTVVCELSGVFVFALIACAIAVWQWRAAELACSQANAYALQLKDYYQWNTVSLREKFDGVGTLKQHKVMFKYEGGGFLDTQGNPPEEVKHCFENLRKAEWQAKIAPDNAEWKRDMVVCHVKIGDLIMAECPNEAERHYREALEIDETMARREPDNTEWQSNLSECYKRLRNFMWLTSNLTEAEKYYRKALEIDEALAGSDPGNTGWQQNFSDSCTRFGDFMRETGRLTEAEKHYRRSLEFVDTLARRNQDSTEWQRNLSVCHNKLGNFMCVTGNLPEAEKHYRKVLEIVEVLARRRTSNTEWQHDLFLSHERLGNFMRVTGNLPEAEKHYCKALDVGKFLVGRDPDNAEWQYDLSKSYARLGNFMRANGNLSEAGKHYRKSLEFAESLSMRDPDNAEWQHDLSICCNTYGDFLKVQVNLPEAEKYYRKALEIGEFLSRRDPDNVVWQRDLCCYQKRVSLLAKQVEQWRETLDWFSQGLVSVDKLCENASETETATLRIKSLTPIIECDLALNDYESALRHQTRLVELCRETKDSFGLVGTLLVQSQLEGQLGHYSEAYKGIAESCAIATTLSNVNAQVLADINAPLCWWSILAGKYAEACAAGEKAVSLLKDDKSCPARVNLAHACLFNGQFEKAKAIYTKYLGTAFEDGRKWNDEVRNDFKVFREAGRDHPDMKKIEALLDGKGPA